MSLSNPFSHELSTTHHVVQGDAGSMPFIADESIHLALTSPPQNILKVGHRSGNPVDCVTQYETYLPELRQVFSEIYRVLVPGGRLVCVTGDMWLSRKKFGRHRVIPFHADISVTCRKLGFDNLNPIIWQKTEGENNTGEKGSKFLGAPYEPNGLIQSEIKFILMQRKPGGYRKPTREQRALSRINKSDYKKWFSQFWNLSDGSRGKFPSPFLPEIADRLIKMFSFWGDTVLDPFCGTGTSLIAAMRCRRNSVGIDMDEKRCRIAFNRLQEENEPLFANTRLLFHRRIDGSPGTLSMD